MYAKTLTFGRASRFAVASLALLLSACIFDKSSSFRIGGSVSGLTGSGLVLQNNGGDNLAVSSSGSFTFPAEVKKDQSYHVTVFTQPSGQTCTMSNGSGTAKANVTNVAVTCASNGSSVGGTVSGLTGSGLVLQDNGGDNLSISASGAFTFATLVSSGATYNVTVFAQPAGQGCSVTNGGGTIASANVTNVAVACVAAPASGPTLSPLGFGVKQLQFSWTSVSGATFYRLLENPDGASGFSPVATNITALSYNYTVPVHLRLNASYEVEACNAGGCAASAPLAVGTDIAQAIGYVKASNTGASDRFGFSIAVSGDGNTLAVGATLEDSGTTGVNSIPDESASNSGAVYVFVNDAGTWSQQAYIKASDTAASAAFGYSLALSDDGSTLAVGARNHASGTGAAYVFVRTAGAWSQQALVTASNAQSGDLFGSALALSGDGSTLAVGAPFESSALTGVTAGSIDEPTAGNGASFSGAVYVFASSAGVWTQQAYAKASNTESLDLFGSAVALSGDGNTLAVGAPLEDSSLTGVFPGSVNEATTGDATSNSGAVYVFARNAGVWSQQAYAKASNTGAGDQFGTSIALSSDGNTLAAGAPFEASGSTGVNSTPDETASGAGAAYVYVRAAGTWSQQAYVKASNAGAGDNFSSAIALSGDGNTLAAGSPFEDSSGTGIGSTPDEAATDSGAVYVYARSGGAWSQQAFVKASNTGAVDNFGSSVALSGDGKTLGVGAPLEDGSATGIDGAVDDNAANSGAAYLY
jgi:FG-GAP repeat